MSKATASLSKPLKLTAAEKAKAKALGFDLSKLDLGKLLELFKLLAGLFGKNL